VPEESEYLEVKYSVSSSLNIFLYDNPWVTKYDSAFHWFSSICMVDKSLWNFLVWNQKTHGLCLLERVLAWLMFHLILSYGSQYFRQIALNYHKAWQGKPSVTCLAQILPGNYDAISVRLSTTLWISSKRGDERTNKPDYVITCLYYRKWQFILINLLP
jgi:hypothetical protein